MKKTRYSFSSSAEWVTTHVCKELKEKFQAEATVKRTGKDHWGGTLTVKTDSLKEEQVKSFLAQHPIFSKHFKLAE